MNTLNGTVAALIVLSKSTRPTTPQAVDRIVDPYLIKLGKLTNEVRGELAEALIKKAPLHTNSPPYFLSESIISAWHSCFCYLLPSRTPRG
jgi:hypothetical protein